MSAPDYVTASSLLVTVLRPKKDKLTFMLTAASEWEALWRLEHPSRAARLIGPTERVPAEFRLTLFSLPRRTVITDLTMQRAIELARGEIENALDATAGDRSMLAGRIAGRDATNEVNRRGGSDASGERN